MHEKTHLSNACWAVKALAILFVISAHTGYDIIQNSLLSMVLDRLGSVAVPVFMIIAGYFFQTDTQHSVGALMHKKMVGLCIPWFFCGSIVYAYTALRGFVSLSFSTASLFLIGSGSYLYYLPVLLVLQIFFYFMRRMDRQILMRICLLISAASLIWTASGHSKFWMEQIYLTDYLNPFNWCGFFSLGYAAQKLRPEIIVRRIQQMWIPAAIIWVLLLIVGYYFESGFGYFSWLGYPMELCSSILMFRLGLAFAQHSWLCHLGKYSFTVYLLHIQIVPIVAKFLGGHIIGVLVSPVITYAVTFGAICLVCKIAGWLKLSKLTRYLLGTRTL